MQSVWSKSSVLPKFQNLKEDIKTDVLIIGGGIAGILTAFALKQAGVDYTLVEAQTICSGITKNTTAKITSQHGLIYNKITKTYGKEKAKMYLDANENALLKYMHLCESIDCDFEKRDAYVYSLNSRKKIEDEVSALNDIGFAARFVNNTSLPFSVAAAVKFENQAQFNPLKFLSKIAAGLNIYEHTRVIELIGLKARTETASITAKKIIVATHFPFINKHGCFFMKMYQHRSYVIALSNTENIDAMYLDEATKGMSFRSYGKLLLLGGGDHRTGKKGGKWQELLDFTANNYENAKKEYQWATQDCMTLDGIPYIGLYSKNTPDLYVATGFNKWGITTSFAAAEILCDMVQGKENPYSLVFNPERTILHSQLALNALSNTASYLTPTTKRCPHMGCALTFNTQEQSWDCSCHGSRFTKDGKLIDNPATGNLK